MNVESHRVRVRAHGPPLPPDLLVAEPGLRERPDRHVRVTLRDQGRLVYGRGVDHRLPPVGFRLRREVLPAPLSCPRLAAIHHPARLPTDVYLTRLPDHRRLPPGVCFAL